MLFNYLFLLKGADYLHIDTENNDPYELIIPITGSIFNDKAALFQQLYNTPHHFCFILTKELTGGDNIDIEELVHFLLTLLFLPNYIRYKGSCLLLLEGNIDTFAALNAFRDELSEELNKQVTKEVIIDFLDATFFTEDVSKNNRLCIVNSELNGYLSKGDKGIAFESFIKSIINPSSPDKKWIVPVDAKELDDTITRINHFESYFSSTQPLLSKLVDKYKKAEANYSSLHIKNEVLTTKLQNSSDNIKVLRESALWYVQEYNRLTAGWSAENNNTDDDSASQRELRLKMKELADKMESLQANRDAILEWYKKEYEVLPKWYKRFGHIIKVATGKRTVKSLFE